MRVDARQHLHQRGLAGAVLADHGVDLAGAHAQVHVLQRGHAVKALRDAAHVEDRVVHLVSLLARMVHAKKVPRKRDLLQGAGPLYLSWLSL
jgi:hypothetical protein